MVMAEMTQNRHIYRHASNEQNVNFPLLIYFNRSVSDVLKIMKYTYLCSMFIFCVGI